METKIFHGEITPNDFARNLIAEFNQGYLRAHQLGNGNHVAVQIGSRNPAPAGGQTALTVTLKKVEDGVAVQIGQQSWLGVAASLGQTAFWTWRNPWNLINRLDDLAQDIQSLQLADQVWKTIEATARSAGVSYALSLRLQRVVCEYCRTANPVGEPSCVACGAPLGDTQPVTCLNCGFVIHSNEVKCPNCGKPLHKD